MSIVIDDGIEERRKRCAEAMDLVRRLRRVACLIDQSDKLKRTGRCWQEKTRAREDALALGTRVTIGPNGYAGCTRYKTIMRDFKQILASTGNAWELYQLDVIKMFCNSNLKRILGTDVDTCIEYMMRKLKWTDIPNHVFVQAYRGAGKSAMSSAIVACFLLNIPMFTMTMYGGPRDKALDLFETFVAYFMQLLSTREDIAPRVYVTKRRLKVDFGGGDIRWVEIQFSKGNAKKLPVVKFKQTNPAGKKRKPIGEKKIIDISRDDGEDDMEERLFAAGPRKRPELALVTENMKAALSTRAKRVEISEAEKDKLRRRITTAKRQDAEVARKKRKIVRLRRSLGRYTADTAGVLAALSGRIDEHWAQLQYVQGLEPKPAEKKKRKQTKKTDIIVIRKRKHSAVDQQKKKKADVVAPTEAVKTSKPTKKRAKKDVAPKPKITIIRAGAVAKKRKPVKKIQGDAVTKTAE